ncbi:MAG: PIN domain-containing protein [Bacteroidetes bacterium]|jgi:PIN domain nuclease of toxin-antitoxin system|nr:PIN domain-containing protein [Bacteroidota bacterium]
MTSALAYPDITKSNQYDAVVLDTHAFLWFIGGDDRLSERARNLIATLDNEVFLSVASLWEMAIKINVGKLRLPRPFGDLIPEQLIHNEIQVFHAELPHMTHYVDLPLHHRDPFDRMIIAQAQGNAMKVVTRDRAFSRYDVDVLW